MQAVHELAPATMPDCKLRFNDRKNTDGKVVSNPTLDMAATPRRRKLFKSIRYGGYRPQAHALWPLVACALTAGATAQPRYEVVDLTEKYGITYAKNLNDNGVIGANVQLADGFQAALLERGKIKILPHFEGRTWGLFDLADNGDVMGNQEIIPPKTLFYSAGKVVSLPVMGAGDEYPLYAGSALNNHKQVVGFDYARHRPYIWTDGVLRYFTDRGYPWHVNDAGVVVGGVIVDKYEYRAVCWIGDVQRMINPRGARISGPQDINAWADIVGDCEDYSGHSAAAVWFDGVGRLLGDPHQGNVSHIICFAINNFRQIVGRAYAPGYFDEGFLWQDGKTYLLRDLVLDQVRYPEIDEAIDINNRGQILAYTRQHALLLNPR